jgi:hypothetical protein
MHGERRERRGGSGSWTRPSPPGRGRIPRPPGTPWFVVRERVEIKGVLLALLAGYLFQIPAPYALAGAPAECPADSRLLTPGSLGVGAGGARPCAAFALLATEPLCHASR